MPSKRVVLEMVDVTERVPETDLTILEGREIEVYTKAAYPPGSGKTVKVVWDVATGAKFCCGGVPDSEERCRIALAQYLKDPSLIHRRGWPESIAITDKGGDE